MNEDTKSNLDTEMLDEYDFSQAVRGNPYPQLHQANIKIETKEGDPLSISAAARIVQIKTVEVTATVAPDGKVTLQLPPEITPGEHHITLLIQENLMPQTA
ncbi:MAG: hypothetical protein HC781_20510 [Leptolyngbyaceae cyanobacterium CSU_1_4]|nr:hypothetical protein [Leptolyngbyaceae cyanobacterium CSU_1_4]